MLSFRPPGLTKWLAGDHTGYCCGWCHAEPSRAFCGDSAPGTVRGAVGTSSGGIAESQSR